MWRGSKRGWRSNRLILVVILNLFQDLPTTFLKWNKDLFFYFFSRSLRKDRACNFLFFRRSCFTFKFFTCFGCYFLRSFFLRRDLYKCACIDRLIFFRRFHLFRGYFRNRFMSFFSVDWHKNFDLGINNDKMNSTIFIDWLICPRNTCKICSQEFSSIWQHVGDIGNVGVSNQYKTYVFFYA